MAKKFNPAALNSVNYAAETINQAMDEAQQNVQIQATPDTTTSKELTEQVGEEKKTSVKESKKTAAKANKQRIINIELSAELYKRLAMAKVEEGRPMRDMAVEAIEKWLTRNKY